MTGLHHNKSTPLTGGHPLRGSCRFIRECILYPVLAVELYQSEFAHELRQVLGSEQSQWNFSSDYLTFPVRHWWRDRPKVCWAFNMMPNKVAVTAPLQRPLTHPVPNNKATFSLYGG